MRNAHRLVLLGVLAWGQPLGPAAQAAPNPCLVTWTDPGGDTVYTVGSAAPAYQDDDLDATAVTVKASATEVAVTVQVAELNVAGPGLGTGHGVGVTVTAHGKAVQFAARKDATYGDATSATGDTGSGRTPVRLSLDAVGSTFTVRISRADLARIAGASRSAGKLTGFAVSTLRHDHPYEVVNKTPAGTGAIGQLADGTQPSGSTTLSLDACDASRRVATRLTLSRAVHPSGRGWHVTATLRTVTGSALGGQRLRLFLNDTEVGFQPRTDGKGQLRITAQGNPEFKLVVAYDGMQGRYTGSRATMIVPAS